jgi:hypothetical protein
MTIHRSSCALSIVVTVSTILFATCISPSTAEAQDAWPSFVARTGTLIAGIGSDVRIDSSVGNTGTSIDLENQLGFASQSTTFFVDGVWRISRRNQLRVNYEGVRRDVSRAVISNPISFGDRTFTANAQVDAFLDTFYISGDYGFAFVANPQVELGVSIGLTVIKIHTGIEVSAGVSGGTSVSRDLSDNTQFTVPVPLPGVFFSVRPHPRVTIQATTRIIKATISDITASLIEAQAGADVRLAGPLGVGGAYYFNRQIIERNGTLTDGRVEYRFNGPQAYVTLSF